MISRTTWTSLPSWHRRAETGRRGPATISLTRSTQACEPIARKAMELLSKGSAIAPRRTEQVDSLARLTAGWQVAEFICKVLGQIIEGCIYV